MVQLFSREEQKLEQLLLDEGVEISLPMHASSIHDKDLGTKCFLHTPHLLRDLIAQHTHNEMSL